MARKHASGAAHSVLNTNANLMVALDALLETRSVTAAARLVGVNQSSMSGTLKQLRVIFGDPILVRASRSMEPTPLALRLQSPVRRGISLLDHVLAGGAPFDPATSTEEFVVALGDRSAAILGPPLLRSIRAVAESVSLQIVNWNSMGPPPGLATGEIDVSVGIMVPERARNWPAVSGGHDTAGHSEALYDSRLVSVVRKDHPAVGQRLTLRRFCALDHVLVTDERQGRGIVDDALAKLGRSRRIVARVPTHQLALSLVGNTDLAATIDRRVALSSAAEHGARVFKPPIEIPAGQIGMAWHERTHADAARAWLRDQIRAAAARSA